MEDKTKKTLDLVVVLVIFAVTGTSTACLSGWIMGVLGAKPWTIWYIFGYIIFIAPLYHVLLLIIAFLFGRFNFFYSYQKKVFRRVAEIFK